MLFMYKGYNMARKSVPEGNSVNLSTSVGQDKFEGNYFKNCNNTYYVQKQALLKGMSSKTNTSKFKSSNGIGPASSKRKPISQGGMNIASLVGDPKGKGRSNSRQNISESRPLAILNEHPMMVRKQKKGMIG